MKWVGLLIALLFWVAVFLLLRKLWRALRGLGRSAIAEVDEAPGEATHPGRGLILFSCGLAVVALALGWVQFLWFERSGFSLGAGVVLLAWAYPAAMALLRWRLQRHVAGVCATIAIAAGVIAWVRTIDAVLYFNVTGVGIYVYMASAVLLATGMAVYPHFGRHRAPLSAPRPRP